MKIRLFVPETNHRPLQRLKSSASALVLAFLVSVTAFGQTLLLPRPGGNSTETLIDTINYTRSAYQVELLAVSTYEAALSTPYLKGETQSRVQQFYEDHKKHAETLLSMLDQLGGKSDDIKQIKKNYNWLESEKDVLDHLVKAEDNSEKELSTDAKKTKNRSAKKMFEQLRDEERAHLKTYESLRKTATK